MSTSNGPSRASGFLRNLIQRLLAKAVAGVVDERVRQALLEKPRVVGPPERFIVATNAILKNVLVNTNSGKIVVGEDVFFGHDVRLLAGSHDVTAYGLARREFPSDGYDIVIAEGVWISTGATVLGPCKIGSHAVIAAGSVVTADVPALTVVAGVPARPVRLLSGPTPPPRSADGHSASM